MISTVIYFIGKVLTFPGAYIKAFFEHLIARAFSIPVEDTKVSQIHRRLRPCRA